MKIKKISSDEFLEILNRKETKGLFYYKFLYTKKKGYYGLNNMRGNAVTKFFNKLKDCKEWLRETERYGG